MDTMDTFLDISEMGLR